jgi:hypothetical protein
MIHNKSSGREGIRPGHFVKSKEMKIWRIPEIKEFKKVNGRMTEMILRKVAEAGIQSILVRTTEIKQG